MPVSTSPARKFSIPSRSNAFRNPGSRCTRARIVSLKSRVNAIDITSLPLFFACSPATAPVRRRYPPAGFFSSLHPKESQVAVHLSQNKFGTQGQNQFFTRKLPIRHPWHWKDSLVAYAPKLLPPSRLPLGLDDPTTRQRGCVRSHQDTHEHPASWCYGNACGTNFKHLSMDFSTARSNRTKERIDIQCTSVLPFRMISSELRQSAPSPLLFVPCALPALSKVEGREEKRSLAANPFRIRISAKHARNPCRMRSFKTQDLKSFRMCTHKKRGVGVPPSSIELRRSRQHRIPVLPCRVQVQSISEAGHEA